MKKKSIDLAQAFVSALQRDTANRPMTWRGIHPIAKAAGIERDPTVAATAVAVAIDRGWVLIADGHSVMLTDEGRRLTEAKPAQLD